MLYPLHAFQFPRITVHMAACYDAKILSLLRSPLLTFCPSEYVKEQKRS